MPPRILALILTLVQSNRAILIGSFDSTACVGTGLRAVAARTARPNKALVTRSLVMDVSSPGSRYGLGFWSGPLVANVAVLERHCQSQTAGFEEICGFERIFLPEMTI